MLRDANATSGLYEVDPSQEGVSTLVRCDMETNGGGWTLCASSAAITGQDATELRTDETGSWFACDRFMRRDGSDGFLVKSSDGVESYLDQFDAVVVNVDIPDLENGTTLRILEDQAACEPSAPGNYQWYLQSFVALRYGVTELSHSCPGNLPHSWFLDTQGTLSSGCANVDQHPPFLGMPCGTYGDHTISMSLWYRPSAPAAPLPQNCAALLASAPSTPSGMYWIDPDGPGGDAAVYVRCDMQTQGGGWTLCAAAVGTQTRAADGWNSDEASDWFTCEALLGAPSGDAILVTSAAGGASAVDRFDNVIVNQPIASTTGDVNLQITSDQAACNTTAVGNHQVQLSSPVVLRYGLTSLQNSCIPAGAGNWQFFSVGTTANGCAQPDQVVPALAFNCGTYGDLGARLSVWHRPMP